MNSIAKGLAKSESVSKLYLEGNALTDASVSTLFDAFETNGKMVMVHLDFNELTDASIDRITSYIERSATIGLLDLSFNGFSKKGIAQLKSHGKQHNVSIWARLPAPF